MPKALTGLGIATALALALATGEPARAKDGRNASAAIIGGALLGAAALAAASRDHRHEYRQPYDTDSYPGPGYAAPFHPGPVTTCYPAQGACYLDDGRFDSVWTGRIYGR